MRYVILELALDRTILGLVRSEFTGKILEWVTKQSAETYAKGFLTFDYRVIRI